eukprot:2637611-Pleurochrysis_carterae.AAC.2
MSRRGARPRRRARTRPAPTPASAHTHAHTHAHGRRTERRRAQRLGENAAGAVGCPIPKTRTADRSNASASRGVTRVCWNHAHGDQAYARVFQACTPLMQDAADACTSPFVGVRARLVLVPVERAEALVRLERPELEQAVGACVGARTGGGCVVGQAIRA